ncbi:tetratricopeptide repeat protein [Kamptonema formosum]|uniref:tetratricopeptide repeat protein n=1 Tax=Kamptonema formosum TaxID=331992 RepID=UPI00034BE9E6|nr:tetratricopeptide repeat protein [Oscillatoria sp. PCC 10802]
MKTRFFADRQDSSGQRQRRTVPCRRAQQPQLDSSPSPEKAKSPVEPDEVVALRRQSRAKAERGQYSEAIEILTGLISRDPASAADYSNRGLMYFQSGELDRAFADYTRAIQLNPQLASAYNNLANYCAARGDLPAAMLNYDRAIDLNPAHVRAWLNRGITLRELGLYERAIDNFDFAERLGSLKGHIWAERGRTYHLMGEWNCAVADYRRAKSQLQEAPADNSALARVEIWLSDLLKPLSA